MVIREICNKKKNEKTNYNEQKNKQKNIFNLFQLRRFSRLIISAPLIIIKLFEPNLY